VLRLDQTAALFEVLKAAERGEPSPEEGSRRIRQIVDMRPRFGAPVTILGHVVLTVGICLVLQPTWGDLALAALFGALVAVLKRVGGRWTSVQMIMPVPRRSRSRRSPSCSPARAGRKRICAR